MKTQEAVVERLRELCTERNLSMNGLAYVSALPPSTVKNIFYGVSRNPGVVTLKILCDGLGITLQTFFDAEVFRRLEQEIE